ncbi:hypothetical protein M0805_001196 [Coniferiporia weirii]|nr:hypothetical protein M0805_001196 [Coniferiporia weirii]
MDPLTVVGPHWRGYRELKYLIVFGASYCEVGYSPNCPPPSIAEPLGVKFPGNTYSEPGTANWAGYLAREFCSSRDGSSDPLLVYDYGRGGQMVDGVKHQAEVEFIPSAGRKPEWAPWTAEDTLFATWVGINDSLHGCNPVESITELFRIQQKLHDTGARNFLLINLPPMLRSPMSSLPTARRFDTDPYNAWNTILRASTSAFAAAHPDATVLVFSAWNLFSAVLDAPETFGFASDDPERSGGGIWVDISHPTTRMHRLVAQRLSEFLRGVDVVSPTAG